MLQTLLEGITLISQCPHVKNKGWQVSEIENQIQHICCMKTCSYFVLKNTNIVSRKWASNAHIRPQNCFGVDIIHVWVWVIEVMKDVCYRELPGNQSEERCGDCTSLLQWLSETGTHTHTHTFAHALIFPLDDLKLVLSALLYFINFKWGLLSL